MGCPEQDESTSLSVQLSSLVEAGQPGRVVVNGELRQPPASVAATPQRQTSEPPPPPCTALLTTVVNCPGGSPLFHPGRCRIRREGEGWLPRRDPQGGKRTFRWDRGATEAPLCPRFPDGSFPPASLELLPGRKFRISELGGALETLNAARCGSDRRPEVEPCSASLSRL